MSGVDSLSCVAIGLLAAINSLQAMGDVTAAMGGMDREATDKELRGGILGFGLREIDYVQPLIDEKSPDSK